MLHKLGRTLAITFLVAATSAQAEPVPTLGVILSDRSPDQLEVLDALRKTLENQVQPRFSIHNWYQLKELPPATLYIAVGNKAASVMLEKRPTQPVLLALASRETVDFARSTSGERFSAIYAEQPPARQLNLVVSALPDVKRIGFISGPNSSGLRDDMERARLARNIQINAETLARPDDLFRTLQRSMVRADFIIAVPEGLLTGDRNGHHAMLSTFRARVPVLGGSEDALQAGSLLALYSTPRQAGTQLAEMVRTTLAGKITPPPQYPNQFEVRVNRYVAGTFGLSLAEESSLRKTLALKEKKP